MSIDGRLDAFGNPRLPLGMDTGDRPIMTVPPTGPYAPMAAATSSDGGPLPTSRLSHSQRLLGRVDVSDVIQPNRFRRVYHSVRVRRNDLYLGPLIVVFQTHVGAMIAEELGARAPSPAPARMPQRTQAVTTHSGGTIRSQNQGAGRTPPPQQVRETIPSTELPFDFSAASSIESWNTISQVATDSLNVQESADPFHGEGTDGAFERLGGMVRPRSWTRHTVLQIQYRYPMMESETGIGAWDSCPIPVGIPFTAQGLHVNSLPSSTLKFILMSGSTKVIEIPYPVGQYMPIHFDIINNNPIYAANVNLSATAYVTRGS